MKTTLFLSALWLALAGFFAPDKTILSGTVQSKDGEPLFGASIAVFQDKKSVAGTITDLNGHYSLEILPGIYDIKISYTGFKTHELTAVLVEAGKTNRLDVMMEDGLSLKEVVVIGEGYKKLKEDNTSGAQTLAPEGASKKESRETSKMTPREAPKTEGAGAAPAKPAVYAPTSGEAKPKMAAEPGATSIDGGDTRIRGARTKPTDYAVDGIRVSGTVPPVADVDDKMTIVTKDIALDEKGRIYDTEDTADPASPGTIAQPAPRAGLLTAGEWNDLNNWNHHWADLLNDGEIDSYSEMYGFFPKHRYTVLLTNDLGFPLADVPVQLKDNNTVVWEMRTDNTGKAELWAGLNDKKAGSSLVAEAWVNGKPFRISKPKTAAEGYNFLQVKSECYAPQNVDIMWAVDATGSMGDEIEYLKTEVLDVINRAKSNNPSLEFRMGATFYRDKGDDYLVRSSPLASDINQTVDFIQKQFAGGGGDYPEAVHSALEEVVYKQKWSANAIARICFLVLDASPHLEPEVIASLQKTIREAARLGIRIVPLAASGIQKDTEFLMKFFGLATNGTYLFLTDHSGIGGKHLEPTTDEYKVEPLNDLLVRIITEYTAVKTCEGKSNIRFENDPQQQPGQVFQATFYPNPAADKFTLELPFEVQSVSLYDSEGKGVRKVEKPLAGANVIAVNDLPPGFYTIRIGNNGRMQTGKLMVVR